MGDQAHPLEPERVEHGEQIVGQRLLVVAPGRRVGPAEPAQVDHHQMGVRREQGHHVAPHPPMLRPAMHEHDRVAGSRLGDVEAQPARRHRAMRDAVELREVHQGSRTIFNASRRS